MHGAEALAVAELLAKAQDFEQQIYQANQPVLHSDEFTPVN